LLRDQNEKVEQSKVKTFLGINYIPTEMIIYEEDYTIPQIINFDQNPTNYIT